MWRINDIEGNEEVDRGDGWAGYSYAAVATKGLPKWPISRRAWLIGYLYSLGVEIIPKDVLVGIWEMAKEEAFAGMALETTRATARGADPDATTKRAFEGKIRMLTIMLSFVGREGVIFARESIFHMKVVLEGIWPELGREVGSSKSAAKGMDDGQ
jgi:hypothetical protein